MSFACTLFLAGNLTLRWFATAFMDESVGNLTEALRQRGMWNMTLLVWSSEYGWAGFFDDLMFEICMFPGL